MWVNGRHGRHVLLSSQDQLMVDNVLRYVAKTVQCAGRVQGHGHAGAEVDELANSLDARGLVVKAGADTFADDVPVCAATGERHLLDGHDIVELVADFLGASEGFTM